MKTVPTILVGIATLLSGCRGFGPQEALLDRSVPTDVSRDAYALYSAVYQNLRDLNKDEVIAIARVPLAISVDEGTRNCVKPKTSDDQMLAQNLPRFSKAVYLWSERFTFHRPYKLLDQAEAAQALLCITHAPQAGAKSCEPYRGIRYVRYLSIPDFNRDHSRALVKIFRSCGGLCGEGSLSAYRKTSSGWQLEQNSFSTCVWIS